MIMNISMFGLQDLVEAFCLVAAYSIAVAKYSRVLAELLEEHQGYMCKVSFVQNTMCQQVVNLVPHSRLNGFYYRNEGVDVLNQTHREVWPTQTQGT